LSNGGEAWLLTHQGRVYSNIFVEQTKFDARSVATNNAFSQNDFLDFGTVFPDGTFDAYVDTATTGQIDVEQISHTARCEKFAENAWIDVIGVKLERKN